MKFINKSAENFWVFNYSQFRVQSPKIAIFRITNEVSKEQIIFSPTTQTDFNNYSRFLFTEDVLANQDLPNGIVYVNKALYWTIEVFENESYTTNLAVLPLLHTDRLYVQPFDEECDCVNTPIELGSLNISNEVYDKDSWNGVTNIAPSKNAVRNIVEQLTGNSGGGGGVWGSITGTLSNQTDLVNYIATALTGYATEAWVNSQGFITNVITALGYTPENVTNKATNLTSPDNTKYPTTQAVADALNKFQVLGNYTLIPHTGTTDKTLITSFVIPANTVQVGDALCVKYFYGRAVSDSSAIAVNIEIGGNSLVLLSQATTARNVRGYWDAIVNTSTSTVGWSNASNNANTNNGSTNIAPTNFNIDWTVNQTVEVYATLGTITDTFTHRLTKFEINKL